LELLKIVISLVAAYLLGSIPFAYIFGKIKGIDIRTVGDRNVGAGNVFRHVGLGLGVATLVADIAKGALAILLAGAIDVSETIILFTGIVAVIGHNWPVFLQFRGGRGLAAAIGVLLVLLTKEMLIAAVVGITVLVITGSAVWLGVALFAPLLILSWLFGEPDILLLYAIFLPCLAGLAHWLTTRNLPADKQKEALKLWVIGSRRSEGNETGKVE
jgi:glycerol-3-phosphate acyltransferase PlsY